MAPQKLTDYERKRLENIRRNDEMMAALKLHSKATQLSNFKRPRVGTKSYNMKSEKKPKTETPIVIRRSLRTRGIPPDSKGLDGDSVGPTTPRKTEPSVVSLGPISMADARESDHSDSFFVESLMGMAQLKAQYASVEKGKVEASLGLEALYLDPENIARVVPGRITSARFFPSSSVKMIAVGNTFGNVGFWNVGQSEVHLYRPHRAPISGILIQPHCLSKIYTSCYDGILRLMDAEKEIFDLVFESDESIFALSQPTNETNCLYLAEGSGGLTIWDNRIGKRLSHWVLHESRINTIDFNCKNPHIAATSSTDGTACTWDLRYTDGDKLTALRTFTHKRSVQSAYFSPSGCSLATTSLDNTIAIYSGVNMEDAAVINHNNQTGRWLSTFSRAKWGWDDSYLFVGNLKRGVDVVSAVQRKMVMTLESQHMSAIPCRFDTHSYEVGMLAGATSGGQVYIWTSR
ncbi:WD repeat-containing protein 76 isoform X1 [Glycine max]|uniref:WD repeat-containing protein 76 isoform X1 n=1 Tax=Glycine max TaxID=3847 RepID=UPI00023CF287|nr:WD repeat-containing protein 76 isoform X1 [Glycine max]